MEKLIGMCFNLDEIQRHLIGMGFNPFHLISKVNFLAKANNNIDLFYPPDKSGGNSKQEATQSIGMG
jgi:hypothetical protein